MSPPIYLRTFCICSRREFALPQGLRRAKLPSHREEQMSLRRREFVTALAGAAVAWPLAARAQRDGRVRRIGVLMSGDENDPVYKARLSMFTRALAGLGWTDGRDVQTDLRSGGGDANRMRALDAWSGPEQSGKPTAAIRTG